MGCVIKRYATAHTDRQVLKSKILSQSTSREENDRRCQKAPLYLF